MYIKSFLYNNITEIDQKSLERLFHFVWGDEMTGDIHPREMHARAFCVIENNEIICYVGVVSWDIHVVERSFKMCGLSCVCTHPKYRKQGLGTLLVEEATAWIIRCGGFDIGLFTCSQENVSFYERLNLWERCPNLILKESDREGAYISNLLHLNVFKMLISEKAKLYAHYFEDSTITLNFPKGKFI